MRFSCRRMAGVSRGATESPGAASGTAALPCSRTRACRWAWAAWSESEGRGPGLGGLALASGWGTGPGVQAGRVHGVHRRAHIARRTCMTPACMHCSHQGCRFEIAQEQALVVGVCSARCAAPEPGGGGGVKAPGAGWLQALDSFEVSWQPPPTAPSHQAGSVGRLPQHVTGARPRVQQVSGSTLQPGGGVQPQAPCSHGAACIVKTQPGSLMRLRHRPSALS